MWIIMRRILHLFKLAHLRFLFFFFPREAAADVMWCHSLQLLSQDKNNFSLDVKYAACGMCQRGLWGELGHSDIEQEVENHLGCLARWGGVGGGGPGERWGEKLHFFVATFGLSSQHSCGSYSNERGRAWRMNSRSKSDINLELAFSWRQQLLIKTPLRFLSHLFRLKEKSMLNQNKRWQKYCPQDYSTSTSPESLQPLVIFASHMP